MIDFLKDLLKVGLDAFIKMFVAFAIGTGATAIACWYYELPIVLSLLGGILVLGLALALMSDSIFD